MQNASAILFDLDGTIFETKDSIVQCHLLTLKEMGITPPPLESFTRFIGPPMEETYAELVGPALVTQALAIYRRYYIQEGGMLKVRAYDGIQAVLAKLKESGKKLFVATSKYHVPAEAIVAHFGFNDYFVKVYGSYADGTLSAKKDLLAHILAEQGLDKNNTLMIGDRKHDMVGATQNNLRVIGAGWGYGSAEELNNAGATCLAQKPLDLLPLLLG